MTYEIACESALVTGPAEEPLSLDEAKNQASIVANDDDALINAYIIAARQEAESYMGRGLFTQTRVLQLAEFGDVIPLPYAAPLQSVTSVQYYDADGTQQTLATSFYIVDTTSEPGRVLRAANQAWPSVQSDRLRRVTITYVCGWTSTNDIPELIKQGCRLYVSYCDADRSGDTGSEIAKRAAHACWRAAGQVFCPPPQLCAFPPFMARGY